MEKKNQSEAVQSRREFFKKAAIGAIPILGGFLLASCGGGASSIEKVIKGAETSLSNLDKESGEDSESCAGCNNRCMNFCHNTCHGTAK
ncbi:MAG: Cys-Xaa-Xaa-Xaa repeat radical SAM target protein [Bacteroidales bacterium]|nr:Cys-Xaa-Xaa-Xaa repeat radical SAM target protein [Bacteroidales bacterium]